jgi:hypothetical protein
MYICKKHNNIAAEKLNIDKLKRQFKDKDVFETKDIALFYQEMEKELKLPTINWRIHTMM